MDSDVCVFVDVAVSAMVLVVAAMFAWFAYSSTHAGNTRGYELAARFHTVAGLAPGADVKISGIKVGAVTGMEIVPVIFDAKVRFSLDPAIKLPVDSKAKIVGEGLLGSAIMGVLGIIAGMQANKIDELAAFQNFIILPLTFLSGVFYSMHSLPPFWQQLSHLNPFFYIVDGFRYGFFGVGDVSPWLSAGIVAVCLLALSMLTLWLVKTGYKMRH